MITLMILGTIGVLALFVASQLLWVVFNGKPVPRPVTPREVVQIGQGTPLKYAVLGDSTAVAQGGDYALGYAQATAAYLATTHQVAWQNAAVSGATIEDVVDSQLPQVIASRPDVVLIAVGANDVTHLTPLRKVRNSFERAIGELRAANPQVIILLTGAPDMGSVPRFGQPLRWLVGERTKVLNKKVQALAIKNRVIFAPIASKTGPIFRARPELFAADKFHPTTEGYQLWIPVLTAALQEGGL